MKIKLHFLAISFFALLLPNINFSQTVNLGILESFEGYTGAGAITNGAGATWKGDAGTNIGIISGFGGPPSFTGNTYNANTVTAQCRFDLFRLYIHLNDLFVDYPSTHAPAFGGGETLTPGVYSIPGAGSIGAALTLDGGGNPDAYFIIKFYGAMTVGAGAVVNLTNGTKSCNVFFIADGAISVAADAKIKGTLFAKIGAVGLGANAVLEGRMLSLQGALVTGVGAVVRPPACKSTIPIFCEANCSPAPAVDVLGVLSNYALYTNLGAVANTSTSGIDGNIGTDSGSVSGFEDSIVIGDVHTANTNTAQANSDLDTAYNALMALPNTVPSDAGVFPVVLVAHPAAFGAVGAVGETVNPGVYFIDGAGSLGGTLTLDGQNDPNAIFVFKFAGAFSVGAQSKIILINGARRCNIFWIGGAGVATGAITIGAGSVLKGTFLSHGGACGSGASVFLAGRQLSTGGAVNTYSGIIYNNPVCVTSTSLTAIDAVTETTPAINGNTGGTTTSLTSNDILKGNLVVIGTASGNVTMTTGALPTGITVDTATGIVTVAANTPAGNYNVEYTICEVDDTANCDTVTSIITVTAIDAVTETTPAINGNTGGTTTALTSNDTLNGDLVVIGTASGNVTMTTGVLPTGITVDTATGVVTVAANTPAGNYSVEYTICEVDDTANCDTVTSIITVTAIDAVTETTPAINGNLGGTTTSLTSNDTLNGNSVVIGTSPGNVTMTTGTLPTGITVDTATGIVTVAANTPAGNYNVEYTICEVDDTANCDTVTSIITVTAIDAVTETTPAINGNTGGTTTALTSNDTLNGNSVVIGTSPGNVTMTTGTLPTGITVDTATGVVTVAANTPAGNYSVEYTICEVDDTANCDTVTSIITVTAIDAVTETTPAINGNLGGTTTSLTSNDTLNGNSVVIGTSPGNVTMTTGTLPTGITVDTATGVVTVATNTPAGNYSVEYTICEVDDTANCDTVTSIITVTGSGIDAVTETTPAINGKTGGTTTPLTSNDTLHGSQVVIGTDPGNVTMTTGVLPTGITVDTATGIVTVAANTPAGNYNVEYTICEIDNTANCDTVTSIITVAAPGIDAVTETTPAINGNTGGTTTALTSNDTLNGNSVVIGTSPGNVTMTTGVLPTGITVNTATGIVTVAANTPAGYYPISYTICEVNNTGNCDTVTSTIVVSAPIIDANKDTAGPINGTTGGTNVVNVLTNDTVNGSDVSLSQIHLTTVTSNNSLTLNSDGSVDIATNTPAGTYTMTYQICEKSNPTNCSQADVTIEVTKELPDFSTTIDIEALVFVSAGDKKDFVVNISEIKGAPSDGQVVFKISKQSAFLITYGATTSISAVNGDVTVNNNDWTITESSLFITTTLKAGVTIGANTFSAIGFTIERQLDVPTQTSQPITVTIVNGSGLDSQNYNNTYNTVLNAQ
ncbi:ice-binding family protein [Flavobacterium ovatum]|uniref:beta strand repeat-containing protein n=1 Tax=Flavobacterium ovatum TaxID=1928857 RepID=UPI00344F0960